jgi:hypothetical protein
MTYETAQGVVKCWLTTELSGESGELNCSKIWNS